MSAEPAIARVQPASPTTLFLMGVAQGRTTVIALGDNGTPIGQYDVIVLQAWAEPARRQPRRRRRAADMPSAPSGKSDSTCDPSDRAGLRCRDRPGAPADGCCYVALCRMRWRRSRSRRSPAASSAMTRRSSTP